MLVCVVAVSGAVPVYMLSLGWTDAANMIREALPDRDLVWLAPLRLLGILLSAGKRLITW